VAAIATSFFNVSEPTGGIIVTEPIANVFLRFAICILRFDEFPIPDCTIAKQRFLFFCILHLCIYAFDEFLGLRQNTTVQNIADRHSIACPARATSVHPESSSGVS
jgi:hypothetical protein